MGATQSAVVEDEETEALEQQELELLPEDVAKMSHSEFSAALATACQEDDFTKYRALFEFIWPARQDNQEFDDLFLAEGGIKHLKYAFRHGNSMWRETGVRVSRTFFHNAEAREKLVLLDFVGSMMVLTMPKGLDMEEGGQESEDEEFRFQLLAAETILEMADYPEFMPSLCSTSVLNFLCIALNQVPASVEIVTHTFVKISGDPQNLQVFLGGSVGDILESFFKSTSCQKPSNPSLHEQWARNISAIAHCAHSMGTMIKYDHACQVDLMSVGDIFATMSDNLRLISELSRLFYWICRKSEDLCGTLIQSAPGGNMEGLDTLLYSLSAIWSKSVDLHQRLQSGTSEGLSHFLIDELDGTSIEYGSEEFEHKKEYAEMLLCYMNCLLWVLLPETNFRWRFKDFGLKDLHYAVELREPALLQVILGTMRHLLDRESVQQCHELMAFFGEQLLNFIDLAIAGRFPDSLLRLLLDAVSILSLQRDAQTLLADYNIWGKLNKLVRKVRDRHSNRDHRKIELAVLRVLSQVAVHPAHRLGWVAKDLNPDEVYPPREEFEDQLEGWIKRKDEHCKTIASLLLSLFEEGKFQREVAKVETTLLSIFDWWQVNSTTGYEPDREDAKTGPIELPERLLVAMRRAQEKRALSSMETMAHCAPYECVVALSLFSRLALEPKFKSFFYKHLEPLLACVCTAIAAEAREAAATLANLMWAPGIKQERLVCWLKFDGSRCLTVDAANVLLPIRAGEPKPVDIGQGVYKSTWGVEFVPGSCLTLHPDGLKTYNVPGLLTTASPLDTFKNTAQSPYHFLDQPSDPRHFTVSCWFFWPLRSDSEAAQCVLLQSSPPERMVQLFVNFENDEEGVWTLVDYTRTQRPIKTPKLNAGWHLMTLVSSTDRSSSQPFNGTKFFLDEWCKVMKDVWILNDFYVLGNDLTRGGRKPFGLIADFRIYARSLSDEEVHKQVTAETLDDHPDHIVRRLAELDAASALAQRLEVPDCAAECLRALGSLATLSSQRAKIFHVCGRQLLRLMKSPQPMVQRQAKRLLNNLS